LVDQPLAARRETEAGVRKTAFLALLDQAAPVEARAISGAAALPLDDVSAAFETLRAAGQVETDAGGRIVGAGGLSLLPTVHRLSLRGFEYYTWCAEDAVGIPAALGESAEIESECAHCRASVRLSIRDGAPPESEAVVGFGAVERCESVRDEFCPTINFFCNVDDFEAWRSAGNEGARVVGLGQAAALGKVWWGWVREEESRS